MSKSHLRRGLFVSVLTIVLSFSLLTISCSQEQGVESVKYGSIQGKVLYSNGSDHSGITVTLDRTDGLRVIGGEDGSRAIVSMVSTARDGSFSFQNLEPGTYTVYASSNDSVEKAVSTNVVVEGSKAVTTDDLHLTVTGSISGYVLKDGQTTGNMGFVVFLAGTSYVAVTDDTGYYCISGVPAGKGYKLAVSKGSYTCSDVVLCTVTAHGTTNVMVRNISSADLESGTGTLIWKGSFATAPANPGLSWAYYNTSDKCYYKYNGTEWVQFIYNGIDPAGEKDIENKAGTASNNLVYNSNFESGSDTDLMADGSVIEVVSGAGIDGSNAMAVTQTENYGEVLFDITDYYGRGKSYYVEASFRNAYADGARTDDLNAKIGFCITSGAGYDLYHKTYDLPGQYDESGQYINNWLDDNETYRIFEIHTGGAEGTNFSDGRWHTISGIIDAEQIEQLLVEQTQLCEGEDVSLYNFIVVFYVGTYSYEEGAGQSGYVYYLDNVVIKDLNSEISRTGATYNFNNVTDPEDPSGEGTYTITFNTNGGSSIASVTVEEGSTVTKPKKNPTYKGYIFAGWYSDAACTVEYDFNSSVYSNKTIYAKWIDQTVYEHCDPILPAGTGQVIPTNWSVNPKGMTGLPAAIYNFAGDVDSTTNVTSELKAGIATATADPNYFDEIPKKVLVVFSEGMGVTSVDMSREYKGELILDSLPYYTQSKTDAYLKYQLDGSNNNNYTQKTTTDSSAAGTQILTGYKTRYGYIALDVDANPVMNLSEAAKTRGWYVACVTNDNIADSTPADSTIHETSRYHYDVIYFKELMSNDWDLLMGWDWGMGLYFGTGSWADKLENAARDGIHDANYRESTGSLSGTQTSIQFFKALSTVNKAKVAPYLIYYTLWEMQDPSRLNSWQRWTRGGEAELAQFLAWLDSPGGLAAAIENLDCSYGNPANFINRFTTFKDLLENSDAFYYKPVLGSWLSDGADYEAAKPNRGYLLHGSIGKNYPSWPEMVAYTIYQMDKEADEAATGFFAMIENTCTDGWGHSSNTDTKIIGQMNEVQCFDEGVAIAVKYVLEHPDTLLIVTSDHETGGFQLREGWQEDITRIKSTTTGHSSQNVPLYAFGAGAQYFSPEAIMAKYGSQANANVNENGFVHEGWITGALIGELITGEPFGQYAYYVGQ